MCTKIDDQKTKEVSRILEWMEIFLICKEKLIYHYLSNHNIHYRYYISFETLNVTVCIILNSFANLILKFIRFIKKWYKKKFQSHK